MIEEWKDIEGYEELYQVSNLGRVRSLGNGSSNVSKERIMKPYKEKKGYLRVRLCKNGKYKHFLIHRLVANAFIPNPNNKPFIDHIDTNPSNNKVDNLRWVTNKENCNNPLTINHLIENSGLKNMKGKLNHLSKPILQFSIDGEFIRKWDSAADITRELGISNGNICSCCRGERYKTAYGYIWKYYDIELYCISIMKKNFKKVA